MKRLTQTLAFCLLTAFTAVAQKNYVSEVWVSDLGNGKYKNPVLYADYSDPDACRVGDDFYMTSSSFNCLPGLQILHSKDLVNWTIIGAAVPYALTPIETPERPEHGNRVWAPSIRHHNGEFYIYWGDPDYGIYMIKTKDPKGKWSNPVLVKAGKGMIDATPLWDEDGKVYLIYAYAGSRSGVNSILVISELNAEGTEVVSDPVMVLNRFGMMDIGVADECGSTLYFGRSDEVPGNVFQYCSNLIVFDRQGGILESYRLDTDLIALCYAPDEQRWYGKRLPAGDHPDVSVFIPIYK